MRRLLGQWRAAVVLLTLLAAWELYVDLGGVDSLTLSAPHEIANALYVDRSLLWTNFLVTAREILLGVALATVVGFGLAVAIHLSPTARRAIYPLLVASQTVPVPILAPLLVFWLGFTILPKLIVVALVSFFSVSVATLDALSAVDRDTLKLMRSFDSTRLRCLRHVELPAALPGLFTGAKIAVTVAVIGAVFAEQAGADSGLGYLFQQSIPQLLTARAYAAVVILSCFAIGLFVLLTLAERQLLPWAHEPRGDLSA